MWDMVCPNVSVFIEANVISCVHNPTLVNLQHIFVAQIDKAVQLKESGDRVVNRAFGRYAVYETLWRLNPSGVGFFQSRFLSLGDFAVVLYAVLCSQNLALYECVEVGRVTLGEKITPPA